MALPLTSAFRRCAAVRVPKAHPCLLHYYLTNKFSTNNAPIEAIKFPDPRYVNTRKATPEFDDSSAAVYPGFLTKEEGRSLIKEASRRLKRRRFESGHWDAVITGYREVELAIDSDFLVHEKPHDDSTVDDGGQMIADDATALPLFARTILKTREQLAARHFVGHADDRRIDAISSADARWLPCHAIDLSADGELSAHVDSVKFSGGIVAGLSLLSDSIMRLRPSSEEWDGDDGEAAARREEDDANKERRSNARPHDRTGDSNDGYVDLYLPELSLYVLSGMSRYSYTHELLPSGASFEFSQAKCQREGKEGGVVSDANGSVDVIRGRRLSIIFRDQR